MRPDDVIAIAHIETGMSDEWVAFISELERRATAAGWQFDEKTRFSVAEDIPMDKLVLRLKTGNRRLEVRAETLPELLDAMERALE